jgi:hypothetical protein
MFRRIISANAHLIKYKFQGFVKSQPRSIPKLSDNGNVWADYGLYLKHLKNSKIFVNQLIKK